MGRRFVDRSVILDRMASKDARIARETGLAFPKPSPHLLEKRAKKAALESQDRAERKLVRLRSGGQCEVIEVTYRPESSAILQKRCARRASQNHHLLGGNGRRNSPASILSTARLDVCDLHHTELHHKVLVPVNLDHQYDALRVQFTTRTE